MRTVRAENMSSRLSDHDDLQIGGEAAGSHRQRRPMRRQMPNFERILGATIAILITASLAAAQTTTGTISGHVVDTQGLPVPGVFVSVESPNLQGVRTTVTSETGDYVTTLLPAGVYTLTFELGGLE